MSCNYNIVQGFSASLYPWYRDENGNPRTQRHANGNPPTNANGLAKIIIIIMYFITGIFNSYYVASESTVKAVTYTNWQTRFGPLTKTVNQLVTPKVVVCNDKSILIYLMKCICVGSWKTPF